MNLELFKNFAADNHWQLLLPEISLGIIALALLLLDIFWKGRDRRILYGVGFVGQALVLGALVRKLGMMEPQYAFNGLIVQSTITQYMRVFFLVCSIIVYYLASIYFSKREAPRLEFYHITLVITASMMLLVQSSHFIMMFVALETVTVGFYILVSYANNSRTFEAGVKYVILGALSSAMMLFGIVLLYGIAGNVHLEGFTRDAMNFEALGAFMKYNAHNPLVITASLLVLVGVLFKIAIVPFQMWVPDVYQGAPMPVTAFLAVASKAAGFVLLINLLQGPFIELKDIFILILSVLAVLTIVLGNLSALGQRNLKRLMGLSGVVHAGYLLVGVIAAYEVQWAIYVILFYLTTYMLASFAVFAVMSHKMSNDENVSDELEDYEMLHTENPFLAGVLTVAIGSLAGIPPLAGFIGKVLIFIAAFKAGLFWVLGFALLGVVMSIYYYFGWIRELYFKTWKTKDFLNEDKSPVEPLVLNWLHKMVLSVFVLLILVLGMYQGLWGHLLAK